MKKLLSLFLLAACVQVDLRARFSCATDVDCGDGFHCMPRHAGGGLCFTTSECNDAETCNGADDNCDGRIDETFPEQGEACTATLPGPCAAGERACEVGQVVCVSTVAPVTETCDTIDNDCDGETDETFDLMSDQSNCGACGVVCTQGTSCRAGDCLESNCEDNLDNDGDGERDCEDDACLGLICDSAVAPSWLCGYRFFDGGVVQPDAGHADAGEADAGSFDAGEVDAGAVDAGEIDAGFADAGAFDAGVPDAGWDGSAQRGCFPPEHQCDDGRDEDGDGETDCADDDCDGVQCASGNVCTNRACPP